MRPGKEPTNEPKENPKGLTEPLQRWLQERGAQGVALQRLWKVALMFLKSKMG